VINLERVLEAEEARVVVQALGVGTVASGATA
jgi:hypothetical protein